MRSLADEYDDPAPAILDKYAQKYYTAGNYHHALALRERATDILRRTAGLNDRATLRSQHNLAGVLHKLDRLEESEALATATATPRDDAGESEAQPRLSGDSGQSVLPVGLQLY